MQAELVCLKCKHFMGKDVKCIAFENIIPDIILTGENDHLKPLPDQKNNIIFEPIKKI